MNALPAHLFVSSCDGSLHDTRRPDWASHPLRENYSRSRREFKTVADLKAHLRAGPYAWPGGYYLPLLMGDGALLCHRCARQEFRLLVAAMRHPERHDQWHPVGAEILEGSPDDYEWRAECCHCNVDLWSL